MKTIKAPQPYVFEPRTPSLFLAGSIEMDTAEAWQRAFEEALVDTEVTVLNPRRDDWDGSWRQSVEDENFRTQVEWELVALERATVIAMHFDPATKSPITLLELGLFASSGRLMVSCPEGFWRRGNVEVVCARYGVPLFEGLQALIAQVKTKLHDRADAAHIVGLDHLQLAMPRGGEDQARHFFEEVLGLRHIPKPEPLASRGGCWFEGRGVAVHIGAQDDFVPAKKAHPAFTVADLKLSAEHLRSHGFEAIMDENLKGVRRFYTYDPFGNRVEMMQVGDRAVLPPQK